MTQPLLHPWLGTHEAMRAAQRAVAIPLYKLGMRAQMIGADELLSEALSILTECALPPRERLQTICANCQGLIPEGRRKGAKYCSPQCSSSYRDQRSRGYGKAASAEVAPAHPKTHIGSMWSWPADEMESYAAREVGFRLCHFAGRGQLETPASQTLYNLAIAEPEALENDREIIEAWLEANGVHCSGAETIEELGEAAQYVIEGPADAVQVI